MKSLEEEGYKIVQENGEAYAIGKNSVLYCGRLWDRKQFSIQAAKNIINLERVNA